MGSLRCRTGPAAGPAIILTTTMARDFFSTQSCPHTYIYMRFDCLHKPRFSSFRKRTVELPLQLPPKYKIVQARDPFCLSDEYRNKMDQPISKRNLDFHHQKSEISELSFSYPALVNLGYVATNSIRHLDPNFSTSNFKRSILFCIEAYFDD